MSLADGIIFVGIGSLLWILVDVSLGLERSNERVLKLCDVISEMIGESAKARARVGRALGKLRTCKHDWRRNAYGARECSLCQEHDGWWCPSSPDNRCVYTESLDSCDWCGDPEERK